MCARLTMAVIRALAKVQAAQPCKLAQLSPGDMTHSKAQQPAKEEN
jgi:hypothetical protein